MCVHTHTKLRLLHGELEGKLKQRGKLQEVHESDATGKADARMRKPKHTSLKLPRAQFRPRRVSPWVFLFPAPIDHLRRLPLFPNVECGGARHTGV
jgi:hypothetical protein